MNVVRAPIAATLAALPEESSALATPVTFYGAMGLKMSGSHTCAIRHRRGLLYADHRLWSPRLAHRLMHPPPPMAPRLG
jgi:hypothetical protein